MRKLLLTLILIASFGYVQAQGISVGLRGGLNYSNMSGDGADDNGEYKMGAHAGVVLNYGLTEMVGLKLEGNYSNKGFKYENNYTDDFTGYKYDMDNNYKLNYIDVPLLVHVNAGPLFFEVGPQVSFLVAAKNHNKIKVQDGNGDDVDSMGRDEEDDIKDNLNSVDFGYAAGLGYMSDAGFGVGLRYNGGLSNVSDSGNDDEKLKNSVFQLSLMYMFGGN